MKYSKNEFYDLMERAEKQGCAHLDKQCKAKRYELCGDEIKPVTLPGCGNSALFMVPYETEDKFGQGGYTKEVEVCAVDDDMGRWPRFGGDRFGADK